MRAQGEAEVSEVTRSRGLREANASGWIWMMAQPSFRSRRGEGALSSSTSFRIHKTAPALEALYDDASREHSPSLVHQLAEASRDVTLRIRAGR